MIHIKKGSSMAGAEKKDAKKRQKEFSEDVQEEVDRIVDEAERDASSLKEEMLRAYRNPATDSSDDVFKAVNIEYHCVRATGGTFLERWGVECVRCAWYRIDGSISERISDFEYNCISVPSRVKRT